MWTGGLLCWWSADHRICVWNAVDGSLVHSLTGHDKQVPTRPACLLLAICWGWTKTATTQYIWDLLGE
jgi:hypothetical protein